MITTHGRQDQLRRGHLALTDAIYSTVLEPSRWSEVIAVLSSVLGGNPALIYRKGVPRRTRRFLAADLDSTFQKSYRDYYAALNPWELCTQGNRPPLLVNDGNLPEGAIEKSEFYADWLRPVGDLRYTINVCAQLGPDETVELVDTRSRRAGPFDENECAMMVGVIPHLERAAKLSRAFELAEAQRVASIIVPRKSGTGMLLVDCTGYVQFLDQEAEDILAREVVLRVGDGRLSAAVGFNDALAQAIARATGGGRSLTGRVGTQLSIPRPDGKRPLSVSIAPLDDRDTPFGLVGPLGIVLISAPERQENRGLISTLAEVEPIIR